MTERKTRPGKTANGPRPWLAPAWIGLATGLLLLAACGRSTPPAAFPGVLYLGTGNRIIQLNLTTYRTRTVTHLPDHLRVDVLSVVSRNRLLVSTYPRHAIALLNLKTRHWTLLRSGWKAVAFPRLHLFVFYDPVKPGLYAERLYWASFRDPKVRHLIDPGPFPMPIPVIRVGPGRFLYTSWRKTHEQALWVYDLSNGHFHSLPVPLAYPELRLARQGVLCSAVGVKTYPYFRYDLPTGARTPIRLPAWYTPIRDIPALHGFLVGKNSSSLFVSTRHRWTLYLDSWRNGHRTKLLGHTQIGLDTAVWIGPR
jgi:hypothetical protein